jgi:hypothetical protein
MTYTTKNVNGVDVPLTPEEIAELEARDATFNAGALGRAKAKAALKIDADADAIRRAVLGERATEYQKAQKHAEKFKADGYVGNVPPGVKSWLDAKNAVGANWTAQQAADDILTTAASLDGAEDAIRAARLLRKEQAKAAADVAAVDTALAAWGVFVAAIKSQLGL